MNRTSYNVHIWQIKARKNAKGKVTSYRVRWRVDTQEHHAPFKSKAHADSFRSELITAANKGEAFLVAPPGLPLSKAQATSNMSWYDFARAFVDMKWSSLSGSSRRGVSEALITVTPALLSSTRGMPSEPTIRKALHGWAFNRSYREEADAPEDVQYALGWLSENTRPVSDLASPEKVREVLHLISHRLDGKPAAASVSRRKRAILYNALDYAVERKLIDKNPLLEVKWSAPRTARAIDKRVVVNPQQATKLLDAVRDQQPSGPRLVALFGAMYYAALRPGEAVNLRGRDVQLPALEWDDERQDWVEPVNAWGEFLLSKSAPETGARWSDTRKRRDEREQLKHRPRGETRPVPCPPPLTKLLRDHMRHYPSPPDEPLFQGIYTKYVSGSHCAHVWRKAREKVLGDEAATSPLAKRPYDLRHAAVSTWLNSGVPATQVAEWAGHSVAVLLQVYAKCLAGQEETARKRIEQALDE